MPKKNATGPPKPTADRHTSPYMLRLPLSYKSQLAAQVEAGGGKDMTEVVRKALDLWFAIQAQPQGGAVEPVQAAMLRLVRWELLPPETLAKIVSLINAHAPKIK